LIVSSAKEFLNKTNLLQPQWQILDFEKELFGNTHSLISAYISDENIVPFEKNVNLSKATDVYDLEFIVQCKI